MKQSVSEIKCILANASADEFASIERSLATDTRKGVIDALRSTRRRIDAEAVENLRLESLFTFQNEIASTHNAKLVVGLDEVGRGPVAGPLTIGAVVLPEKCDIAGLNDSKQVTPKKREGISCMIKQKALAWTIVHIEPTEIDELGMSVCLRKGFSQAVHDIEEMGLELDLILLDGNALHIDKREVNVVKGDAKCASIAAASIIAKVERDALMCQLAQEYPMYEWEKNKGYGSASHIEAIRKYGLSPYHRASFCTNFLQDTLF